MHTFTLMLMSGLAFDQLSSADKFTAGIANQYGLQGYQITHTGHSLGGVAAQSSAIKYNHEVITFDSAPGSGSVSKYLGTKILDDSKITSYVSAPNLVNASGEHIAKKHVQLDFYTEPIGANMLSFIRYTKSRHSIESISAQFEPTTCKPKAYKEVASWPKRFEDTYVTYLKNEVIQQRRPAPSPLELHQRPYSLPQALPAQHCLV